MSRSFSAFCPLQYRTSPAVETYCFTLSLPCVCLLFFRLVANFLWFVGLRYMLGWTSAFEHWSRSHRQPRQPQLATFTQAVPPYLPLSLCLCLGGPILKSIYFWIGSHVT